MFILWENYKFCNCFDFLDKAIINCRISTPNAVSDKFAQGTLHKFCMAKTQAWQDFTGLACYLHAGMFIFPFMFETSRLFVLPSSLEFINSLS